MSARGFSGPTGQGRAGKLRFGLTMLEVARGRSAFAELALPRDRALRPLQCGLDIAVPLAQQEVLMPALERQCVGDDLGRRRQLWEVDVDEKIGDDRTVFLLGRAPALRPPLAVSGFPSGPFRPSLGKSHPERRRPGTIPLQLPQNRLPLPLQRRRRSATSPNLSMTVKPWPTNEAELRHWLSALATVTTWPMEAVGLSCLRRRDQSGVQLRDEGFQTPTAVLLRMGSKIWLARATAVAKSGAGPGASAATFG